MNQSGPLPTSTDPIIEHLRALHAELSGISEGKVATYIPELAKANPDWFGICVVTTNGGIYEVGDSRQEFTIQSISKPFVYGLALEDHGRADVLKKVGVEPTGDAFNSISLDPGTGRPRNPMINAGAIASTSLIQGRTAEVRLRRLMEMLGNHAGRELQMEETVYRSESETGHRNRAIGHMLRNFDILTEAPEIPVDLYFRQCSVSVHCRDLAVMAATLANRGVNPLTGKQAIRGEYVESVLGVMGTCGMYDYAGEWLYEVGMPAKSGVAGGIIAVLPGQLGIGVFSPKLDAQGNSVRGIRACSALSRQWDLHLFNRSGIGRSSIRLRTSGAEINSNRIRTPAQTAALREHGAGIQICQLQGNLNFASTEIVVRELGAGIASFQSLIFDLKRVLTLNESACLLLFRLAEKGEAAGVPVVFTHVGSSLPLRRFMKTRLGARFDSFFRAFDENDAGLEWCENRLLQRVLPGLVETVEATASDYELLRGLDLHELEVVRKLLVRKSFPSGHAIINVGEEARELYFLAVGHVSVIVPLRDGRQSRLATFSSGMVFGEMAMLDRAPRSATIVAEGDVACDSLSLEALEQLGRTHPQIKIKLLENLARETCRKLRKANRELAVLS